MSFLEKRDLSPPPRFFWLGLKSCKIYENLWPGKEGKQKLRVLLKKNFALERMSKHGHHSLKGLCLPNEKVFKEIWKMRENIVVKNGRGSGWSWPGSGSDLQENTRSVSIFGRQEKPKSGSDPWKITRIRPYFEVIKYIFKFVFRYKSQYDWDILSG